MSLSNENLARSNPGRLGRLAHFIARHRWPVIGVWVVLTLLGGVAAGQLSSRWYQSLSVPGKPAYEGGQRTLKALGVGVRAPSVVVFHTRGDATKDGAIEQAMQRAAATVPGARTSSYFSTGRPMYVSRDRHTTFEEVYPPGPAGLDKKSGAEKMRAAAATGLPAGITVNVTGHDPLEEASAHGSSGGSSVLLEAAIGGLGAVVILLFVFGTLPAVTSPAAARRSPVATSSRLIGVQLRPQAREHANDHQAEGGGRDGAPEHDARPAPPGPVFGVAAVTTFG
jgi:RND superfamily putative drug exporter